MDSDSDPVGPDGEVRTTRSLTVVEYPEYRAVIRQSNPFGITSLTLSGQPGDFAHWTLPLSDWEWFWYDVDGRDEEEKRAKLIMVNWGDPEVERREAGIAVRFGRDDVVLPGIGLAVEFRFQAKSRFEVGYTITNASADSVPQPYKMLGFPGFSNHKWVSVVGSNHQPRRLPPGFDSLWEEAQRAQRAESTLSFDELDGVGGQPLKALTGYTVLGQSYWLQAEYFAPEGVTAAQSAHVNKPDYLTSHVYILMEDLAPGQSITHTIAYELGRTTARE